MPLAELLSVIPAYLLAVVRVGTLCMAAPLFGSSRVPRRVKVMFALVAALGMAGAVPTPTALPADPVVLVAGLVGELMFGLLLGLAATLTFVAGQWAGDVIGQQMGFHIGEIVDPTSGGGGSAMGNIYFILTLMVFFFVGGHVALIRGVGESFAAVPPLTAGLNRPLFELFLDMLASATALTVRLAAPVFITALVVDLALGCIGKTMPQMNLMTAGLALRAGIAIIVVALGVGMSWNVIESAMIDLLSQVVRGYTLPAGG